MTKADRTEPASTGAPQPTRRSDGYGRIVAIELDGPEGAAVPGPVKRRIERDLSNGEWLSLKKTVSQIRLWSLPTGETLDFIAMYGSTWLLEIADHERYHVVQRWSGRAVGPLGREMLSLARVDPKPMY